jgi:hypothetical protein
MEEPHHDHAHAHPRTGFRWLDISLSISAFFVSLTTLWFAIHNAHTMERLVTSNSYPNVDVDFGNQRDMHDGEGSRHVLYLALENTGIGPARLRSIELTFAGQPARNLRELLASCCTKEPLSSLPKTNYWSVWDDRGAMLPAGKSIELFDWAQADAAGDPRFPRLEAMRSRIGVRVCYCSVFNECYLRERAQREPHSVKVCPEPAVPYTGD